MSNDQFKSEPPVTRSPNWAAQVLAPAAEPAPLQDFYTTPAGDTITECAVCIYMEAIGEHGDELDGGRPYRAVTAVAGIPACREHLGCIDEVVGHGGGSVVSKAARLAMGEL